MSFVPEFHRKIASLMLIFCKENGHSRKNNLSSLYFIKKTSSLSKTLSRCHFAKNFMKAPYCLSSSVFFSRETKKWAWIPVLARFLRLCSRATFPFHAHNFDFFLTVFMPTFNLRYINVIFWKCSQVKILFHGHFLTDFPFFTGTFYFSRPLFSVLFTGTIFFFTGKKKYCCQAHIWSKTSILSKLHFNMG